MLVKNPYTRCTNISDKLTLTLVIIPIDKTLTLVYYIDISKTTATEKAESTLNFKQYTCEGSGVFQ